MTYHLPLVGSILLTLVACAPSSTQLSRNGMNHGGMMNNNVTNSTFLPAQDIDITSLPAAKESTVMEVKDGDSIELNPTIVRTMIGDTEIAMYGYNGQIPGPRINVQQGSTFTVKVTNNIDLPTAIHWHGLRLDNASDGAVGATQEAIEPGKNYTYTVNVPDEGIFWYHPHVREDIQQDMGLYGLIHVTPKNPDAYVQVDREEYVILDDILLNDNGIPVPYGKDAADHTLMGRFGNTFLINGSTAFTTDGNTKINMDVGLGEVVRYYFLNASNTRTYRIIAPLQGGAMKLVGADMGRLEQPLITDEVIISPSERVIVDMNFLHDGVNVGDPRTATVPIVTAGQSDNLQTVLSVNIVGGVYDLSTTFNLTPKNVDVASDIDTFRPFFDKPVDKTLVLDMDMMGSPEMMHGDRMMAEVPQDGIEWEDTAGMMNTGMMSTMMKWKMIDASTGAANDAITYNAKVGDKLKIRIINKKDSPHPMQHPIHFHGQRFLVLSDNSIPNKSLAWKDTVLVPAGHTVDILLDVSNPGEWMFHCHIAEHLSNGMMGMLHVE